MKYTAKKLKQYFNPTEKHKEQKHQSLLNAAPKAEQKNDLQINLDDIDQFRFTRSQARELRDGDTHKTLKKSKTKYLAPTRRKELVSSKDAERPEYKYVSQNEKTRTKQEKLNELAGVVPDGVRRSGRNVNRTKMIIREDDDYDEEDDYKIHKVEEPYDPNYVKCQMCNKRYRLQDLGLKAQPEGSWQCFDCLEKIAGQRQTRSSTRRFGY